MAVFHANLVSISATWSADWSPCSIMQPTMEKKDLSSFAGRRHLLGHLFAVGVGFNEFLQATQLAFDAGQTGTQGFFLLGIG